MKRNTPRYLGKNLGDEFADCDWLGSLGVSFETFDLKVTCENPSSSAFVGRV